MEARSDYDLLVAWGAGDKSAGTELVRRHYPSVVAFFRSKVDDRPEDLAQHTFEFCLKNRERYRADASLRGFLLGVGRHLLFDHYREQKRGAAFDPETTTVADLSPSPSSVAVQHEEQRILMAALRQIPVEYQITIELFYWEDLSISEVADALEVQPGTVKSRLHRARALVRESLARLDVPEALARATFDDLAHWAKGVRALLTQSAEDPVR